MSESELYKELGILTNDRDKWEESIPYVSSLLAHDSVKIKAKVLWLLGEMGLVYPLSVQNAVPEIASFCDSSAPLLRERAVNALGRIGRGCYQIIEQYWTDLFRLASDEEPKVRLSFIWASVTKLSKGETVSMEVLMKVCKTLNCDIGDIMELIPTEENETT